jgi:hypothetical protein
MAQTFAALEPKMDFGGFTVEAFALNLAKFQQAWQRFAGQWQPLVVPQEVDAPREVNRRRCLDD